MSQRSAPFVIPDTPNLDEKDRKKHGKVLLSTLQADIAKFRDDYFPPPILEQVADMPIYTGNLAEVQAYHEQWRHLIDRAKAFYPSANLPPDFLPLPASLEIPQFVYRVQKLHLTRTKAKESKNFGSVGALVAKCGEFDEKYVLQMENFLQNNPDGKLVAHREFIDLRAYVFCKNGKGEMLEPERLRFYRTGLIVHALPDFKLLDSRQTPRKKRNDAYKNPIAQNDVWKVFAKY